MSAQQHKIDSSLNNLPENNASKSTTSGSSSGLTGVIGNTKANQGSIPTDTSNTNDAPLDKHGDSWGGGIPGHNNQCK